MAIADLEYARVNIPYIEIDLPLKRVSGDLTRALVSLDNKDVLTATDQVNAAKKDFTPVVKVVSAKPVEVVGEEKLEPAQQGTVPFSGSRGRSIRAPASPTR